MKINLDDKRVFVSTDGDGMGRKTVLVMQELGAKDLTCDIDQDALYPLLKIQLTVLFRVNRLFHGRAFF